MKFKGELKGFKEIQGMLQQLPQNVENRVLQSSVMDTLRPVRKEIAAATPRSKDGKRSAASKQYGQGYRNIRLIRLKRVPKGTKAGRIDTGNAFWLFFIERGTRYLPANPFFSAVVNRLQERIVQALGNRLTEGVVKEAENYKGGKR